MKPNIVWFHWLDDIDLESVIHMKQDELLDLYSLYQKTGISWVKEELFLKAYELHVLDPNFTFQI